MESDTIEVNIQLTKTIRIVFNKIYEYIHRELLTIDHVFSV